MKSISLQKWCEKHDRLDLIKNWDKNANKGLTPNDISYGDDKINVYLKCPKDGYVYDITAFKIRKGQGCPVCAKKRFLKGYTDLQTLYPEVAKEFHPTKNKGIKPDEIFPSVKDKFWWICSTCGHEWDATANSKTRAYKKGTGNGCPSCTSANRVSKKETIVYHFIKKYFESAISSYKPIEGNLTEFDIYIPELKIAIEYDGQQYHKVERDLKKDNLAKDLGVTLLRIREPKCSSLNSTSITFLRHTVAEDDNDFESIIKQILDYLFRKAKINPIYSVDIINENIDYSKLSKPKLTFAEANPEMVLQWNYELNGSTDPYKVHANLNRKFYFNCTNPNHPPYQMSLNNITQKNRKRLLANRGCPLCNSNHVTDPGINDLVTLKPDLASKWDYEKNGDLKPSQVHADSHKEYWFIEDGISKLIKPFNRNS